jgi:hypothetical protein
MKRITFFLLLIFAIALTACSTAAAKSSTNATQTSDQLPAETQLAAGMLKLETTENKITAEQASDLLVYWQIYRQLSQSDTAAQEEVDALIAQIQAALTPAQLQAIQNMKLSQQDVSAITQGSTTAALSSSSQKNSSATAPNGGGFPPAGGIPGDFSGTGSAVSGGQTQSTRASSNLKSPASVVPSALVEMVIQSLQQKIAA